MNSKKIVYFVCVFLSVAVFVTTLTFTLILGIMSIDKARFFTLLVCWVLIGAMFVLMPIFPQMQNSYGLKIQAGKFSLKPRRPYYPDPVGYRFVSGGIDCLSISIYFACILFSFKWQDSILLSVILPVASCAVCLVTTMVVNVKIRKCNE